MKTELECMKKFVKMLNSGATQLNQILTTRRPGGDHRGLRYAGESSSQKTVFVKAKTEVVTPVVSSPTGNNKEKTRRSRIPICHSCKRKGHVRLRCYQYLADLRRNMSCSPTRKPASRMIWQKKEGLICNVVHTVLKTTSAQSWYFDSGCSRHMT